MPSPERQISCTL